MAPAISFGTGWFPLETGAAQLDVLRKHKIVELDTAWHYQTEATIGKLNGARDFSITTKATCFYAGAGKKDNILKHAKDQFENLGVDKVRVYMFHAPELTTDVGESLDAIQVLYKERRFEKFGLSNFDADQVREVVAYATKNNYVLPTVYQSSYNLLCRHNETSLFPILKELGFDEIQAYSPSAGGFLVKTTEQINNPSKGGRWDRDTKAGQMYQSMYNKPTLIKFLDEFTQLAKEYGVSQLGMAYRWVLYHSALGDNDKMIIGATSLEQLEETLLEVEKGPLDEKLAKKLNDSWAEIKAEAPVDNFASIKKWMEQA